VIIILRTYGWHFDGLDEADTMGRTTLGKEEKRKGGREGGREG